ncbi:hypothetical protein EDC04DRAFT_236608 [Pisolithus marmoratus]|nr:hypothetical protein EDC04DRAFT_236608 [Pisolithus marmoratus]
MPEHAHLPRSIWAARVIWGRWGRWGTGNFQVTVDVNQCPGCCHGPRGWTTTSTSDAWDNLDMPGLVSVVSRSHRLKLDGWWVWLDKCSGQTIILDMKALGIDSTDPVYRPVVSRVSGDQFYWREFRDQDDDAMSYDDDRKELELHRLKGYSLPANQPVVLLLKAFSTYLAGKHLVITVIQYSDILEARDSGGDSALNDGSHFPESSTLTTFHTVASPQVWRREPACTQRREQFISIRECFYALVNMRQLEARDESANRWKADEAIKFFSEMFGLKYLRNFVGEITFFKELESLMVTESRNEVSVGGAGGQPVTSTPIPDPTGTAP